ncbi:hypothetical protein ElyMa_001662600 [Elysia marginata]|uniref:Uncharacterized protein n=1 Tax=Elysia marginata TaxID=1093978 RepID=A0AAV4JPS7_9GAST|nr:hypothetical protein ElyMa_001662600 [Elysia marginata]
MASSYLRSGMQSVIQIVSLMLILRASHAEPISRSAGDFHHGSSQAGRAAIAGDWDPNSFQAESRFEPSGGNWDTRQEAPTTEAGRFSTASWHNLLREMGSPRPQGTTNAFPAWSHLPGLNSWRLTGRSHDQNTSLTSPLSSALQNVLRETAEQDISRGRSEDNGTLEERLEASLARVETNVEALVAGFLQLQRSVFNLEQLQELLVLLLEDILKETGIINGSPRPGSGSERSGSKAQDGGLTSGRASIANIRNSHETQSVEDGPDEETRELSDEHAKRRGPQGKEKNTRSGGDEQPGRNEMWGDRHSLLRETHHADQFVSVGDLGKTSREPMNTAHRGESRPFPQQSKARQQSEEVDSEEDEQKVQGSESRGSEEEYDEASDESETDVDVFSTQPSEPATTQLITASPATDIGRQSWSERLVGLSNDKPTYLNRDLLQHRLRARFDNLVQQVAARLSGSLLAATRVQTGPGASGRSKPDFHSDLPRFHVFNPLATSEEDLEGFSTSATSNILHRPSGLSESTLTRPSPYNQMGPESPHEPPPLMLLEPLLISHDAGDNVMKFESPRRNKAVSDIEQTDIKLHRQKVDLASLEHADGALKKEILQMAKSQPQKVSGAFKQPSTTAGETMATDRWTKHRKQRSGRPDVLPVVSDGNSSGRSTVTSIEHSDLSSIISSDQDAKSASNARPRSFITPRSSMTNTATSEGLTANSIASAVTDVTASPGDTAAVDNLDLSGDLGYDHAIAELLRDLSARLNSHHAQQQKKIDEARMDTVGQGVATSGGLQIAQSGVPTTPASNESSADLTSRVLLELDNLIWLSQPGMGGKFKPVSSDSVRDTEAWDTAQMMNAHENSSTLKPNIGRTVAAEEIPFLAPSPMTEKSPIKSKTKGLPETFGNGTSNLTVKQEQLNETLNTHSTTFEDLELSNRWEWLRSFFNSSVPEANFSWEELFINLAQMTQIPDLSEDLISFSERGRTLLEKTKRSERENGKASEEVDNENEINSQENLSRSVEHHFSAKNETNRNENFTIREKHGNVDGGNTESTETPKDYDVTLHSYEDNKDANADSGDNVHGDYFGEQENSAEKYEESKENYDDDEEDDDNGDVDDDEEDDDYGDANNEDDHDGKDDDFSVSMNAKYRKRNPHGRQDNIKLYRIAGGEKPQDADTHSRFAAQMMITKSPMFDNKDLITYINNHNERERNSLDNLARQSLDIAEVRASHEQGRTSDMWRGSRRRVSPMKNDNLHRQKRQTFYGGSGLGHVFNPQAPHQVLNTAIPSSSLHSQHSINAVHQQDQLLPKIPIERNIQDSNLLNTLMSSLLGPSITHTVQTAPKDGGTLNPHSNTVNRGNPYSVSQNTQILQEGSNKGHAAQSSGNNHPFNQVFGTIFPALNTNQLPLHSNSQHRNINLQQGSKLVHEGSKSNHMSLSKPYEPEKKYNSFFQPYPNYFQNPQTRQSSNHNTNRNNYHYNPNSLSHTNSGPSLYQGSNYNQNSFMQTPQRNAPPGHRQHHYPIGGYGHYMNQLGIHFPDVGFIGGPSILGNPAEPGELPSFEPEDIMTNIFKQYWQRWNRMYNLPGPPTTTTMEPGEYEGEITTTPVTTTPTTTPKLTTTTTTLPHQRPSPTTTATPTTTNIANVTKVPASPLPVELLGTSPNSTAISPTATEESGNPQSSLQSLVNRTEPSAGFSSSHVFSSISPLKPLLTATPTQVQPTLPTAPRSRLSPPAGILSFETKTKLT